MPKVQNMPLLLIKKRHKTPIVQYGFEQLNHISARFKEYPIYMGGGGGGT